MWWPYSVWLYVYCDMCIVLQKDLFDSIYFCMNKSFILLYVYILYE